MARLIENLRPLLNWNVGNKVKSIWLLSRPVDSIGRHYTVVVLYATTCFCALSSCAQNDQLPERKIQVEQSYKTTYSEVSLVIDGVLDDEAWQDVQWEAFDLSLERAKNYETRFKILRHAENLVVAISCADPDPGTIPQLPSPRDNPSNDWVEVDFDTDLDHVTAYSFSFSPYGTRTDILITGDDEDFDERWNPKWAVRTQLNESGWQAEVSIPLNAMSYPSSDQWGFQLVRHVSSIDLTGYWAPIPKDSTGYVRHFGRLSGLGLKTENRVTGIETDPEQRFGLDELEQDIHVLKTVLYGLHPALDRYKEQKEIDSYFERIESGLSDDMTVVEFYKLIAPIFHLIGDGHSFIELSEEYRKYADGQFKKFPLGILFDGHSTFVTRDFSTEGTVPIGSQLISINGRTTEELIQELLPLITRDGQIETGALDYLGNDFNDLYTYINGDQKEFELLLRTPTQKEISIKVQGLQEDDFIRRDRVQSSNPYRDRYWTYHLIEDGEIAYLSLEGFGGGSSFRSFIDETFEQIKEDGAKSMILDLRYNYGGNDRNGIHLYSYLTDGPFTYFDRFETNTSLDPSFIDSIGCCISWEELDFLDRLSTTGPDGVQVLDKLELGGFEVLAGEQSQAENHFSGPVVVLINGGSFSVTSDLCAHLRDSGRAIFVGEETGGAIQGNTSGIMKRLTLPNTRLQAQVAMIEFVNTLEKVSSGSDRGIVPEHQVIHTPTAIAEGADQAFEKAIEILDQTK